MARTSAPEFLPHSPTPFHGTLGLRMPSPFLQLRRDPHPDVQHETVKQFGVTPYFFNGLTSLPSFSGRWRLFSHRRRCGS